MVEPRNNSVQTPTYKVRVVVNVVVVVAIKVTVFPLQLFVHFFHVIHVL